jgi:hypothetical protein
MSLLLQTAKAILHEVDGIDGGYDPNSYIPPNLVEALRAAIEMEEPRNQQLHPIFRSIVNSMVPL